MSREPEKSGARSRGGPLLGVAALALALLGPGPAAASAARGVPQSKPSRSGACLKRNQPKRRARRCAKSAPVSRNPTSTSPPAAAPSPPGPAPGVRLAPAPASPGLAGPLPESAAPPPVGPVVAPVMARIFAADSVWSTPLPGAAAVDPSSTALIGALAGKVAAEVQAGVGPRLGGDSRASLYRVGALQPRVPVLLDTGPWGDRLAERFGEGVPIPPGAQPVSGSDHSMAVWQPAADSYWEFFKMQQALHAPQLARGPKVTAGCALPSGDYVYVVTSLNASGETSADAQGVGAEVEAEGGCVTIRWSAISGAIGYRVYRGATGASVSYLATLPADSTQFRDEGLAQPDGSPPPAANTAVTPGEWHAAYGGQMSDVSASPGYYRDRTGAAGEGIEQSNWGSAASGLPLVGGLITKEDVERGSIDHAVSIGLDNSGADAILRAGQFAFPAQRTDGKSSRPDSIPEGARLMLDPDLDLESLELSPLARLLAEAAQRYGLIVEDGSPSTLIYAEDPAPDMRAGLPNFYRPLVGSSSSRALLSFPWQDLEVAAMQLCTSHPCLPD
jgi:hypothetical protein